MAIQAVVSTHKYIPCALLNLLIHNRLDVQQHTLKDSVYMGGT